MVTCRRFGNWSTGCKPAIEGSAADAPTVTLYFQSAYAYILSMEVSVLSSKLLERLRAVGLRPTRQRIALARLLFDGGDRHITAEQLHGEALGAVIRVSLATVYNTLHQFTDAGLLREVVVEPGRSYFDSNTTDHHHFFCEA